jgi:DNA polymerase III epsilon subunit-like protein
MDRAHIMVDLETMGTAPGSAIASIGACVFDPATGTIGHRFYRAVDLRSCQRAGLTFDADTILWWLKQGQSAREALTAPGAIHIAQAIQEFGSFWREEGGKFIWGHGANFDEPLLSAAHRALSIPTPWDYWNARCTRTIFALTNVQPARHVGTHHNALDDALRQAEAVCVAWTKFGAPTP